MCPYCTHVLYHGAGSARYTAGGTKASCAAGMIVAWLRPRMPTILVAEDDAATAEFIALVLMDAGCTVVHVQDGLAALARLPTVRPHLVLADFNMPGMDGGRLCQHLSADPRYQVTPYVLMSIWWHDAATRLPCVTAFLRKPFLVIPQFGRHQVYAARGVAMRCASYATGLI